MKHQTERKLLGFGCLAVLVGIFICFYLAHTLHFSFILGLLALIGVGNLLLRLDDKCDQKEQIEILKHAFAESELPLPDFQYSPQYGFPSYTLTFPTEADLKKAEEEGCIAIFKERIQALYGQTGPKDNPFDIERAVWVTYKDWQFPPDAIDFGKPNDQSWK